MKRILILGGNFFQKTAIIRAKELGYYVITADYLPNNPGHKYADEYHNVSTTDKEAILELAQNLMVDGILSYASDVSAPTAAYVSEKMGLPTNPYYSVETLVNKGQFREFMKKNGLDMISGEVFSDINDAKKYAHEYGYPIMVKPVDSSGSKGVTKLEDERDFEEAFNYAKSYSLSEQVIVEKFIQKKGYQIDGDGFISGGVITNFNVMDQHNNVERNPHAPIGLSYPSIQPMQYQHKAYQLIQEIFNRLDMRFGAFNFEYIIGMDDNIYLLEIGPRNGGNFIPDTIKWATGVDMISASIKACVGDTYTDDLVPKKSGVATSYVIHSLSDGKFEKMEVDEVVLDRIKKQELFVKEGEHIRAFRNGGDSLGCMVLEYDSIKKMNSEMDEMWNHVFIKTIK